MAHVEHPAFVRYLLKPDSYPHPVSEVRLVQTHISFVFLAGEYVYKFKKPVDYGFLDFSNLEKRKFFCEQELRLNRRLCPTIYLDVMSVSEQNNELSINGPGRIIEYGVKMRRMPEQGMLGNIIKSGGLTKKIIDDIIKILVPFYAGAVSTETHFGGREKVREKVLGNLDGVRPFIGEAMDKKQFVEIFSFCEDFLVEEGLFDSRIAAGRVRECHGDLYSANICVADQVYIFDCIEFNPMFRNCDVASDIAFLAMDLDFYGLNGLSDYFVERFVSESGDPGLLQMLSFYKCYRASVRGKIGLLTAHEPEVDREIRDQSLIMAGKYFDLACRYAAE
ncbi:MAG: hypothetical protein KKE17_07155 [Proteobacteria bacterium]|nr:hypothetical protein [Pseudomonadota bacterium]MBU1709765.1 hypothetical protein [Pseudomonadota bacterium]